MTKIIKNGIQYNIDPSAVNAKELLVTTPEVEVIASKQPYQQKQLQYALAHTYGLTQSERIQENKRNANIASNYFNSNPSIGNLAKGAWYWLKSKPYFLGQSEDENNYITGIAPTATLSKQQQLELFNQGRLALMNRYNTNQTWEQLAKNAGLNEQNIKSFRDYATKLLSTKQSPEEHLAPIVVRESPYQYSQSTIIPSHELPLKRYLDYKPGGQTPQYTGIHESAHMSTLNYDPATEYRVYGQLILNPNAKQAINKIMNNADKLADQLQIDPNKIQVLRENLINVQGKTPIEAEQIIKDQLQYLKTGQETRARGLAAQEWIRDNHSVEVPQTVDNGVNFFTNESLRNVWRNMAVGIPLIWGCSRITQSHSKKQQDQK